MSANLNPKTLSDLGKYEADLLIICRRCGRRGIFEVMTIIAHFQSRGWSMVWGNIACRFRCRGTRNDPGCGSKDVSAQMAPRVKAAGSSSSARRSTAQAESEAGAALGSAIAGPALLK